MKATSAVASALCLFAAAGASFAAEPGAGGQGEILLRKLEAKWGGVMTRIHEWNADSMRQFREGYRNYPQPVLEKALAAGSFEAMRATLDAHATTIAQRAMAKAFPKTYSMGLTAPEDASNDQVVEARKLAAKVLGEEARDLVFIPITPCTVWDTRFATNPASAGIINNAATKKFYSHLDGAGGSFAAYGGNPSCPETAQDVIGMRPFAVMMTVYINDATANGWLTLYRDGDPDPSFATISVYYSPGPTRTQTVVSKSSRGFGSGTYDIAATSRFASTHASAAVTGYFVKAVSPPGFTGRRRTSDGFIYAETYADIAVPDIGTLRLICGPNAQSGELYWLNANYASQYVIAEYGTQGGVATFESGVAFPAGGYAVAFPDSATNNLGRRANLQVITYNAGGTLVTATVSLQTRPSGLTSSCFYGMDVLSSN